MKKTLFVAFLLTFSYSVFAQSTLATSAAPTLSNNQFGAPLSQDLSSNLRVNCVTGCSGGGSSNQGTPNTAANAWPVIGAASATTNISGTITLGGTFQTISASSTTRKSFEFQNNSSDPCYLFFGVLGSATLNTSLKVPSGGSYLRSSGALPSDAINVTCTTTADVFYAAVQSRSAAMRKLLLSLALLVSAQVWADGLVAPGCSPCGANGAGTFGPGILTDYGTGGVTSNLVYGANLPSLSGGTSNIAIGAGALDNLVAGSTITAIGRNAGNQVANSSASVYVGDSAGSGISNGSSNVVVGTSAGTGVASLGQGVFVGYIAGPSAGGQTNVIGIGNGATTTKSNQAVLGNTNITQTLLYGPQAQTAEADASYSIQTPSTGFTITVGNTVGRLLLNPSGTLATGTVTLPATPANDGQIVRISSTQIVTSLTISPNSGQTIAGTAPTTIGANATIAYIWNASGSKWYPTN